MIKYVYYKKGKGSLDVEVNNYLFFLNNVCFNENSVRRYVCHIISLYEKLNHLSVNYVEGDIEDKRTTRKSSRYVTKIKKLLRKIKKIDINVFLEAAKLLEKKNGKVDDSFINRYTKNNWDADKISRTVMSDISSIIKRKRNKVLASDKTLSVNDKDFSAVFFDELSNDLDEKINSIQDVELDNIVPEEGMEIENQLKEISKILDTDEYILDSNNEEETIKENDEAINVDDFELENMDEHYDSALDDLEIQDIEVNDYIINNEDNVKNIENKIDIKDMESKEEENSSNSKVLDEETEIKETEDQFEESIVKNRDSEEISDHDTLTRILSKVELQELKKEIDNNEDLFVSLDDIFPEQRLVIKSYLSICNKYTQITDMFDLESDELSSMDVINIYERIYDFVGFLISELFEHVIRLSKVTCDKKEDEYEEKYVIDQSVVDIFGKYDIFIAKIQGFVGLLNDNYRDKLSPTDRRYLSDNLWNKYRLEDINPLFIKEAVSLDLLSFINQNPFTLLQTVPSSIRKNDTYKKYDLNKILENVDFSLVKYIPELVSSIESKIMNSEDVNDEDKVEIINNIKRSFSYYIGLVHGIKEFPRCSYKYLVNYILTDVFAEENNDLNILLEKCVSDIYDEEISYYNNLGLLDKMLDSKKPKKDKIRKKINQFCEGISNIEFNS